METTIPFNILLLPLLGGFAFVSTWNVTRWHAVRASRERLIFYAALAGFFSLTAVFFLKIFIAPLFPCSSWRVCLPTWWERHVPFEYSGLSVSAFSLSASLGFLLNLLPPFDKDKQAERIVKNEGGPFEQFLDAAMKAENKDVLLTLTSGKFYVGQITSSFVPDQRDQTITVWPMWSGYRNEKHQLEFTTDYASIYKRLVEDHPEDHTEQIKDFRITIPIREIKSATFFNKRLHAEYFGANQVVRP